MPVKHRYHLTFGHYSFTQERRAKHYPLPNPPAYTSDLSVFSASQANFSSMPQVLLGIPSSLIKWSPSLLPPKKPQ